MSDHEAARRRMVENQLRPSRIAEPRLLEAMGALPRELFVPKPLRGVAYADEDIPLGRDRFLIEPLALAKLVQAARVRPGDVALVIGDATGYAGAVVSRLAATVFLLLPAGAPAAGQVEALLNELGCENVVIQQGGVLEGLPEQAPFDVILLVGSVEAVPETLAAQLAEGGRLSTVVQQRRNGRVTVVQRVGAAFGRTTPFDAAVPPLPDLPKAPVFEF
jgi:protein-L-isoaspartate(D-aspartate) O-methyltransferase